MVDQDGLVQVGSELMLGESMAQDNTMQEDLSLRSDPEVALGVAAAVHEHPLHQISPVQDKAIPVGSTPDRGGSAPPFDMSQMMEMIKQIMDGNTAQRSDMQRMDANMKEMKGEMQNMGISLQAKMKAGQ